MDAEPTLVKAHHLDKDQYEGGVSVEADMTNEFTDLYEIGEEISQQTYIHA